MKKLLYVGNFDVAENMQEQRNFAPSAAYKMNYICSAATRAGWDVTIVSPSGTKGKKICRGKRLLLDDRLSLKLFFSLATRNKIERGLRVLLLRLQLFFYLLCHTKKNEPVLVYHSLTYARMIRILKKMKKFRLILEVEEIYSDVSGQEDERRLEYALFPYADAFLFPSELLDEKINCSGKPSVIIYGAYKAEADGFASVFEDDGSIHCVYAGTLDVRKGGAMNALHAAEVLSPRYHIHILGFGSSEQETQITEAIEKGRREDSARISYHGLLTGEDYVHFIQSCQVGLCTQTMQADFNDTSFPSKVFSYMANKLRVVAGRIPVLKRSKIADLLYFYDIDTPHAIAEAILGIDFSQDYDSFAILQQLDEAFCEAFSNLLANKLNAEQS